ncbi:MAG: low molecular weight phosphotyrosine protein phosphatase [Methylobacteriaceae bacterium]|jgi:protein-tyrosine phosphatase|nr:low molecular weight phosphotyrosine protein phosphatase [Methylobacteriaceae bacterium]
MKPHSQSPSLLFVCLGNICRSPLAEGAFRSEAERLGVEVMLDSAGIGGWHIGEPPDVRAQAVALKHGVEIGGLRGRQIAPRDFLEFDRIFAMDHENIRDLKALRPGNATARLSLLMDCVPGKEGRVIPDPYYGGPREFEQTWQAVSEAARCWFTSRG